MNATGRRVLMLLENHTYPQDDRVRREALTLTAAGYRVAVIAPVGKRQPRRETVDGVHVYRYRAPAAGSGAIGYLWEYGAAMAWSFVLSLLVWMRHGIDVVHAHNPPDTFVFIGAFYKLFGKRFVFDHHDLSPEMYIARFRGGGSLPVYRMLVALEKLTCRLADHVIATNESYRAMDMQRSGVPAERISIVRNGPDLNRVRLVEPDPALRAKAPAIIGYVGVMGFQDGVDFLLRALAHLRYTLGRTDFYAVIIGKGDAWEELQTVARDLKLEEHVWFPGRVSDEDLLKYLSTTDICADPDPFNPFNDRSTMIKMMEYMALGKPIVAFDLTEHRYTAEEAALYVRGNDELEFAGALQTLMDDPARRQAMGAYGRARVEAHLDWRHWAPRLLQVYEALGSEGRRVRLPEAKL